MHEVGDDRLLIDDRLDLDFAGWEWRSNKSYDTV